jgi:hypothetical protein
MGTCAFYQQIDRATADAHKFADEVTACSFCIPIRTKVSARFSKKWPAKFGA